MLVCLLACLALPPKMPKCKTKPNKWGIWISGYFFFFLIFHTNYFPWILLFSFCFVDILALLTSGHSAAELSMSEQLE